MRNTGDFWAGGLVFCGERKPNQNSCETENHRINNLSVKTTGFYISSGILPRLEHPRRTQQKIASRHGYLDLRRFPPSERIAKARDGFRP
jgi:hypothetical protein